MPNITMAFFLYYFSKNNFPLLLVIGTLGGGREREREREKSNCPAFLT